MSEALKLGTPGDVEVPVQEVTEETFHYTVGSATVPLVIKRPTQAAYLDWVSRFITTSRRRKQPNWAGAIDFMASQWFVGFSNIKGSDDVEVPNTLAWRKWLLNNVDGLLDYVQEICARDPEARAREEGNSDSSSD